MIQFIRPIPFRFWFFVFSLLIFVSGIFQMPFVSADADQAIVQKYHRDNVALRQGIVNYHLTIDALFNESAEMLISGRGDSKPPEDDVCSDTNVSTYCLAERAVHEYEGFVQGMESHRGFFKDKKTSSETAENTDPTYTTTLQSLEFFDTRTDLIDGQILVAQKALDVGLAAYNELQSFYPLHAQYSKIIEALESYRTVLGSVRREVEQYPEKFNNVSTTKCS